MDTFVNFDYRTAENLAIAVQSIASIRVRSMEDASSLQALVEYPREDLNIELKGWLDLSDKEHQANLAQALLALANYGGGYVLLGFNETGGTVEADEDLPSDLSEYNQDHVNGIVHRFADPPFHCEVHHVERPQSGHAYPVIVVPGDHSVPIRSKRDGANQRHVRENTYYTRIPGPQSSPISSAHDWDSLIRRCVRSAKDDLLDDFRNILVGSPASTAEAEQGSFEALRDWEEQSRERWRSLVSTELADEDPSRHQHGIWTVSYSIVEQFEEPDSLDGLKTILSNVERNVRGWPAWSYPPGSELMKPYPYKGLIECWLKDIPRMSAEYSDFWRAAPDGKLFLLRGYREDSLDTYTPGTEFDVGIPPLRMGEYMLHAQRMRKALNVPSSPINFRVRWEGLSGRQLVSNYSRVQFSQTRVSRQDTVVREIPISVDDIRDALPELIESILGPLYEAFDFYKLPKSVIMEAVRKMRKRGEWT